MIAMKDRENKNIIAAYEEVYAKLEARGHRPKLHILDNECSKCIRNYLEGKGTKRHHVAPHAHSVNAAEPAVKTAKYHLIAALCSNARLELSHPTVEQDDQTSSGHTQHVQNIKK